MLEWIKLLSSGTIVLIAVVTYIVVWAIKQTKINNQFLPIVAIVIGAVIGAIISVAMADTNIVIGLIDGVIAGAVSVGGNELVKSIMSAFSDEGGENDSEVQK